MTDIFTEIWNQVQADRARALWTRLAPYVIGGALAIIGGVGGYEFYKAQRDARFERAAYAFEDGLAALGERGDRDDDDIAAAKEHFSRALGSNYASLASMYLADLELRQTDQAETALARERAIIALEHGAQGKGVWASMARLKLGYLVAENGSVAEVEAVLAPLISGKGGGYAPLAREIVAATAIQAGDTSRARAEYQRIVDDIDADQVVVTRAEIAIDFIDAAPLLRTPEEEQVIVDSPGDVAETEQERVGIPVAADIGGDENVIGDRTDDAPSEGGVFAPSLAPGLDQ